ncbi:MAG: DUF1850 domain-containing protein [Deltaproteobacteria bacterium]|nr:DUF1850 domain-containing protein [Deltaproteobacteria bacterium]
MKRRHRRALWLASLAGVVALGGLALLTPLQRLETYQCETGLPLLSLNVRPGTEFSVWFFHSYDRSFFQEHYRLEEDGRIFLDRMSFKSSLNGQGFEMGKYRSRPDGSAELTDINKEMREITFRLGSPDLANHTLMIRGRRLRLLDYAEAGDLLSIRSVARPLWRLWWRALGGMPGKTDVSFFGTSR